ncbi:hypothetical protein [Aureimonas altamirensis]|uniref:hypothetical protein n=1 Tax=Aureimonas altamirensis TaxID=370622 RepID=UPI0025536BE4|nr:hypothetical protein [Aureimonas altamirensis]
MGKKLTAKGFFASVAFASGCFLTTAPAKADWACEVALCISNPAGPMAVSECVPPITQLYDHLAKGRSFPLCQSADGYVNFTRYGVDRWEECPDGSRASYRYDDEGNRGSRRYCETFIPGRGGWGGGRDDDDRRFERREVDGRMVWGEVVDQPAAARSKPRFLDYVVEGESRRLWW